jgi:pentatricopeptide repeat protein
VTCTDCRWLDAMLTRGCTPDAVSYNSVLAAHAQVGDASAALEVFHAMGRAGISASPSTHSIMINALVKANQADGAESLLREVVVYHGSHGPRPPHCMACTLLIRLTTAHTGHALPTARRALVALTAYSAHALPLHGVPASHEWRCCTMCGMMQVVGSGVRLEASSFNSLLSLYAKCGDSERALAILALMEHAHVRPSLVTFNALAACCSRLAIELGSCAHAHARAVLMLTHAVFVRLSRADASYGNLSAAEDALNQAKEAGFVLDRYSFGALLQAASKAGSDVKGAGVRFVRMMLKSGIEVNDFLHKAAVRVVGERTYAELRAEYGHTPTYPSRSDCTRCREQTASGAVWLGAVCGVASCGCSELTSRLVWWRVPQPLVRGCRPGETINSRVGGRAGRAGQQSGGGLGTSTAWREDCGCRCVGGHRRVDDGAKPLEAPGQEAIPRRQR